MNSSVTSRPVAAVSAIFDGASLTRMPAASQITSYSGTSAKPNAKLPATITRRRRVSDAFSRRVAGRASSAQAHHAEAMNAT